MASHPLQGRVSGCLSPLVSGLVALLAIVSMQATLVGTAQATGIAPTISSISPASGSVVGGEQVTINGSGFMGVGGACDGGYDIWFGTDAENGYAISPQSYKVLSDSQISVTVPANFGGPVDVRVHNTCGTSAVSSGAQFTYTYPSSQCVSGTCSVSVSSKSVGDLGHVALGFLNGFNTDAGVTITPSDEQLIDALHPRQWRLGQDGLNEPGGGLFGVARAAGAEISLDLTSDWEDWAYSNDPEYWQTPYGDLSTYYSFIYDDVENRIAAGEVPTYFDVWNEPSTSGTVNQWLSVYGTAYSAIKAADPSAQVVGPSIASFVTTSADEPNQSGYQLSLSDFLKYEVSTGDRFAAIAWHEDGTTVPAAPSSSTAMAEDLPSEPDPGGQRDYWSPAAIGEHVAEAKALISQYPSLAGTKVFVNEYGPTYAINVPGWMVGDFAALEDSGADEGMMTCVDGAACSNLLDGLIGTDGSPQMPYWVMKAYSDMSGSRLATTSSGSNLYVLATRPSDGRSIEALIGRADDCWGGEQCPQFHSSADSRVGLSVNVAVPWSTNRVGATVQALPDDASAPIGSNDVATSPSTRTLSGLVVRSGTATIPLAAVGDGEALYVTVEPETPVSAATTTPSRVRSHGHGSKRQHRKHRHKKHRSRRCRRRGRRLSCSRTRKRRARTRRSAA